MRKQSVWLVLLLFVSLDIVAQDAYQWVFPWVASQDARWNSQVVVTNSSDRDANVTLTAVRPDGAQQTVSQPVPAGQSSAWTARALFDELGSGSGYAVFMSSSEPALSGRYLVFSETAVTANSPSAGEAIPMAKATTMFSAAFLSPNPDQFSAVVAVNTGSETATLDVAATLVTGPSKRIRYKETTVTVGAGHPVILNASELFSGLSGQLNMTVHSSQPLVANIFFYNSAFEPAIASVEDISQAAPRIPALTDADFHEVTDAKVILGDFLFWDKELSGNRDISCATCHHSLAATGDGLSLPVGAGGKGLGVARGNTEMVHERVPRNAPPVFNLGAKSIHTMFHDGRVAVIDGGFLNPAGDKLLSGLDNVLAAQAMFPVTSNAEMAGLPGTNEIADASGDEPEMWARLVTRLMAIPEYQTLFAAAYPDITVPDDVTFAHAANAIAAYENDAFRADNSPFDQFLAGDTEALTASQKRGMSLFYGKSECSSCHAGPFQTDMEFHAIGMPPVGPGKGDGLDGHDDFGREQVTASAEDRYKFRTPPLRNVGITAPYGHSGAYDTLEDVVRHHINPAASLAAYDPSNALLIPRPDLDALDWIILNDADSMAAIAAAAEDDIPELNDAEVADIVAFLHALTDKRSLDMRRTVPQRVPSGLPIAD